MCNLLGVQAAVSFALLWFTVWLVAYDGWEHWMPGYTVNEKIASIGLVYIVGIMLIVICGLARLQLRRWEYEVVPNEPAERRSERLHANPEQ